MRALPDGFDGAVAAEITERLAAIERDNDVRILWAVESGSRAWGFPSPDSDYDCRFLYARPLADCLSLWPKRDTIELPPDGVFDLVGWDLAKALSLAVKGNAVVAEWLASPIVYGGDPVVRDRLLAFATEHADRGAIMRHYLHLGERQRRLHLSDATEVPIKKLFYALRPAAALRWMRGRMTGLPPMRLGDLLLEGAVGEDVTAATWELIERKAAAEENDLIAPPAVLLRFVDAEFAEAGAFLKDASKRDPTEARDAADRLFRDIVASSDEHRPERE